MTGTASEAKKNRRETGVRSCIATNLTPRVWICVIARPDTVSPPDGRDRVRPRDGLSVGGDGSTAFRWANERVGAEAPPPTPAPAPPERPPATKSRDCTSAYPATAEPDRDDLPNVDRVERLPDASHWVHHDEG